MPQKITWTAQADAAIAALRAGGATWDRVAASLGVSRNAALERARALRGGAIEAPPPLRIGRPERMLDPDPARPPLPPGHPVAWGVLVENTCLAGAPYPAPDFSGRALSRRTACMACDDAPPLACLSCGPRAREAGRRDALSNGLDAAPAGNDSSRNKQ